MKFPLPDGKEIEVAAIGLEGWDFSPKWITVQGGKAIKSEARCRMLFQTGNGALFCVEACKEKGAWRANDIWHMDMECEADAEKPQCPICGHPYCRAYYASRCAALKESLSDLFQALLRHPDIRIKAALKLRSSEG